MLTIDLNGTYFQISMVGITSFGYVCVCAHAHVCVCKREIYLQEGESKKIIPLDHKWWRKSIWMGEKGIWRSGRNRRAVSEEESEVKTQGGCVIRQVTRWERTACRNEEALPAGTLCCRMFVIGNKLLTEVRIVVL